MSLLGCRVADTELFAAALFLKGRHAAVLGVKREAQKVIGEAENLLDDANQLSDNINKELEVRALVGRLFYAPRRVTRVASDS